MTILREEHRHVPVWIGENQISQTVHKCELLLPRHACKDATSHGTHKRSECHAQCE